LELGTFADSDSREAALAIVTQANQDQEKAEDKVKSQAAASVPSSPTAAPTQNPAAASHTGSAQLASRDPAEPAVMPPPVTEPFGLVAAPVAFGNVLTKWSGVEADIRADDSVLVRCRENIEACPAPARDFLAIVDHGRKLTGRARIGVINRAVNMAIEPMSDMAQWGVPDRWSSPLETLTTHRGDCEDYAIAKYVALTQAGIPAADVKLVIIRNTEADEDHAVVAVRADGGWIMLDNRWLTLVEDNDMAKAIPLFVLDGGGVRQFMPATIAGARRQSAPASLGF
jgi:predicted transglutaminase-like cysteine proteinase